MNRTKSKILILMAAVVAWLYPATLFALPDQYVGDTAIYGGVPAQVEPNVLFIIDDSGSMADSIPLGVPYDYTTYPSNPYTDPGKSCLTSAGQPEVCSPGAVYNQISGKYYHFADNVNTIITSCKGNNPQNLLLTTGQYSGRTLTNSGTKCGSSGNSVYILGTYINWLKGPGDNGATGSKISIAINVVQNLIQATNGVRIGLMTYHYACPSCDGQGSQFLSQGGYVTTINNMDQIFSGSTTNRQALISAVTALTPQGNTPLGEALLEAGQYYAGKATLFGNTIGVSGGKYTSPIQYNCQGNYIVLVTDGMSNSDNDSSLNFLTASTSGSGPGPGGFGSGGYCGTNHWDCGGTSTYSQTHTDYGSDKNTSVAGVAKYLYQTDLRSDLTGTQNVTTFTIALGDEASGSDDEGVATLNTAADKNHGHGQYFPATSAANLSKAFTTILEQIFSVNSSFVAPVVPVSPQNRSISGNRIYMGLFMPNSGLFWSGNLKKFGIGLYTGPTGTIDPNAILDSNGNLATYVDLNGDALDDRDGACLSGLACPNVNAVNGSFRQTSVSYWGSSADGGAVTSGGVGEKLLARTTTRNIYTYLGSTNQLSAASNAFNATNITPAALGVSDTTSAGKLINFVYGQDAYLQEEGNSDPTQLRSWILSDVLHSKPVIVSYQGYVSTSESACSVTLGDGKNRSMIFVGANDGMLHAFNDCDGSEAWAFIPPALLANLQYLATAGSWHTYYVDFSPVVYIFNKNKDGYINPANGDKVILLFGLRRGGGLASSPTQGYYYALDVTDPHNPQYLWSISNATTGFSEMGEAWSDVAIGKIKVGSSTKIAAFVGAGYDNCNEDGRYGPIQSYPGTCAQQSTGDGGNVTSTGGSSPVNPKGRGIYVIDVATLDSNSIPQITSTSGTAIWSYTNSNAPTTMTFSIPGKIKPVDANYDSYIDTLYVGDAGGNIWRFNIMDTSTTNWTANRIFSSNPGADSSTGRKIFYDPSATVQQDGTIRLYFGTGDREHPLNTAIVDRMYALIDRGQTTSSGINESRMVDVTTDALQSAGTTTAQAASIVSQLTSTTNYGWYVQLNQNAGEKVLSPALAVTDIGIYTTYYPSETVTTDPCATGNLGTATVYVLDTTTGNAVFDYDPTNDSTSTTNTYAKAPGSPYVLMRSDRSLTVGSGIPSGAVIIISASGQTTAMVGIGGNIATFKLPAGGITMPLYWRQKVEFQ